MNNPNHLDLTAEMIAVRISNESDISFADAMKIIRLMATETTAALLRGETVELDGLGTLEVRFMKRQYAEADADSPLVKNSKTRYRPFKSGVENMVARIVPTIFLENAPQILEIIKPMADAIAMPGTVRPYYSTKLTEAQCEEARRKVGSGEETIASIAKRFGVDRKTIWLLRRAAVKQQQQPQPEEEGDDDER